MKLYRHLFRAGMSLLLLTGITVHAQIDCAGYEDRRADYLDYALATSSGAELLILQAYNDLPLDGATLDGVLQEIQNSTVADFRISLIIPVLFLTDGEYDDQILPVLNEVPFWLPDPDGPDRQYWSENHMIMWMMSDWLLHEKYGRDIRPTLRQMLVKWLDMKIEYGFYEYFSPIYYPFTAAAMINLYSFVEDEEIKAKAELAARRLMTDILLMFNDEGYYFPTCGRGDMGKFNNGTVNGPAKLASLITGINASPVPRDRAAIALAISDLDISDICATWSPDVNTTLHYGHPLSEARNIYSELEREDRIIFQWSSGAYFHPLVANETLWQVGNFDLWGHEEFETFAFAQIFPPTIGNVFAKVAASITRSSYIGHVEIDIYRNGGSMLVSSQDMWKGRAGYQIYPLVATVESNPVLIRSGEVFADWSDVPSRRSNDHLPYVDQDGNVALVMYKGNWDLPIWGFGNKEVALKWDSGAFDEEREFDNWQLGRIDDSYIAVKKHCGEIINGHPACPDTDGQTWAVIVGNAATHGSFDAFETMVGEAFYEEYWYFNWQKLKWVYYGHIIADGKDIDHHWLGNLWDAPDLSDGRIADPNGRYGQFESELIGLYPNPAKDRFTLDLRAAGQDVRAVYVLNSSGQEMVRRTASADGGLETIAVDGWAPGLYTVVLETANGNTMVKRLVVAR